MGFPSSFIQIFDRKHESLFLIYTDQYRMEMDSVGSSETLVNICNITYYIKSNINIQSPPWEPYRHFRALKLANLSSFMLVIFSDNSWFRTFAVSWMLYASFWVIPRHLKRRHIKFRRRGITPKKAYNNFQTTLRNAHKQLKKKVQ